jgi:hypothetical protein
VSASSGGVSEFVTRRLSAFVALLGLALVAGSAGCPRRAVAPVTRWAAGGVTVTRLAPDAVPLGPRVQARSGDFLLRAPGLEVVVADRSRVADAGAIVDATVDSFARDRMGGLSLAVEANGTPIPFVVTDVHAEVRDERAEIVVIHESRAAALRVATRIFLVPNESRVALVSELENRGSAPASVRLGDRVRWHGETLFAPGVGFFESDATSRVPWLARPGPRQSYALAFSLPTDVQFRSNRARIDEQVALSEARVVAPRSRLVVERSLVVRATPLSGVASIAWGVAGRTIGWVEGRLDPRPSWAIVELRDPNGRVVMAEHADAPTFRIPVPPGRYSAQLSVPGGTDRQPVDVGAARSTTLSFIVPRAAELAYSVTDADGQPLPARLVLTGIPPTQNPNLGPYHSAHGAANVSCTADGRGTIQLPPGRYSVLATHGLEYGVDEQVVEVTEARGATLRATLSHVVDTAGWVAADFHLHAEPSGDSEVPLPDRVTTLLAEGIELGVATDHNHVTDYTPALASLHQESRLATTPGIEITTREWGHFNAFPYPTTAPLPPFADAAPTALFAFVRGTAPHSIIQVNHPRMGQIGYFDVGKLDPISLMGREGFSLDFDTLEVWNGFDLAKPDVLEANVREWLSLVARGRRWTAVGNSDSHRVVYEWAGYPRTYVRVADERIEASLVDRVAQGLRDGAAVVTSGPFIDLKVEGQGPGASVTPSNGTVSVSLEVRAPPWIGIGTADLLLDGEVVQHVDLADPGTGATQGPGLRLGWRGSVPIRRDGFLVAVVRSTTTLERVLPGARVPSGAFTNPVFVDADADGHWTPPGVAPDAGVALDAGGAD